MRIDTSEPSLTALFNKGQVGLIRTEFMRKDDVIANTNELLEIYKKENAALQAENERLQKEVETWKFLSTQDGIACNERARENQDLENKIEKLKDEVEMLRKADRLVVWNGKEWEVRFSLKDDPVKQ